MKVFSIIKTYIIVLLFLMISVNVVLADGGAYLVRKGIGTLLDEEDQYAQIEYNNGIENLSLSVNLANVKNVDKAVWIFPVPAKPEKIKIDISSGVAFGNNSSLTMKKFSKFLFIDHLMWICASQIYPILAFKIKTPFFDEELDKLVQEIKRLEYRKKMRLSDKSEKYKIYKAISKYGINSELVSLENIRGLSEYLDSKKLKLPENFMKMTAEYIGKDYSFVMAWFDEFESFKFQKNKIIGTANLLEININFETSKIFFPLRLTSLYGNVNIPVNILVNSHVTPELYPEIVNDSYKGKKVSQVEHYIDSNIQHADFLYDSYSNIFPALYRYAYDILSNNLSSNSKKYTQIFIDVPAKNYIKDLWMSPYPPYNLMFVSLILNYNFFFFLLYFILISCLSSFIAGKVCYYKFNPSSILFFKLGIFNLFTIIGYILMAFFLKINKKYIELPVALGENSDMIKPPGIMFFSLTFSAFFLGLNVLFFLFMADVILK